MLLDYWKWDMRREGIRTRNCALPKISNLSGIKIWGRRGWCDHKKCRQKEWKTDIQSQHSLSLQPLYNKWFFLQVHSYLKVYYNGYNKDTKSRNKINPGVVPPPVLANAAIFLPAHSPQHGSPETVYRNLWKMLRKVYRNILTVRILMFTFMIICDFIIFQYKHFVSH